MDNQITNNSEQYDFFSKLLHWILAILLTGLVALGWYMMSIEDNPGSDWYFNLHKSFGLVIASLILLRIIWRLLHKPAPLPESVPRWQAKIARLIHFLLYACIIIMPVTGFLGSSYSKYGVTFFGWQLPQWVAENHTVSEKFFSIHSTVVWVLVVLVALHVLAALKHIFINKDSVFQRMWF